MALVERGRAWARGLAHTRRVPKPGWVLLSSEEAALLGSRPYARIPSVEAMPNSCPHMDGCSMYPLLKLSGSLKTWQIRYCSGEFTVCARYKRTSRGLPVAPDLMPNGVLLSQRKAKP